MRIALCQINLTVGDISGNGEKVIEWSRKANDAGAELVVFPEQTICGYPAEDLLLKPHFIDDCQSMLQHISGQIEVPTLIGFPLVESGRLYNAAALIEGGRITSTYKKHLLPNYDVFDECRYFVAGDDIVICELGGSSVGITICEDLWHPGGPALAAARGGADVIVNLSASPYRMARGADRVQMLQDRAAECNVWLLLCNQVGGQDELVFDGQSLAVSPDGKLAARARQFEEDLLIVDTDDLAGNRCEPSHDALAEVWAALRIGVADYVKKNGFKRVVLGVSGGIDSAVVAALAVDALGRDNVRGITMPSRYSSSGTLNDAHELGRNLSIEIKEAPIPPVVDSINGVLQKMYPDTEWAAGLAAENLQARIRAILLMAVSNQFGDLVLACGNKSEMSVGYATIYGDMAGGFAPIKDVPKTLVWELAKWRNRTGGVVIPQSIIDRPPTAELRADQKDTDSLPPYDQLDNLLEMIVAGDRDPSDVVRLGYDESLVRKVQRLVDIAEYKRRQAPPGIRITMKAFGRDRRMPITNAYR